MDEWYTDKDGNKRRRGPSSEELDAVAAQQISEEALRDQERRRLALQEIEPEQRDYEGHFSDCEAEYEEATGVWSECDCFEYDEFPPNAGSAS